MGLWVPPPSGCGISLLFLFVSIEGGSPVHFAAAISLGCLCRGVEFAAVAIVTASSGSSDNKWCSDDFIVSAVTAAYVLAVAGVKSARRIDSAADGRTAAAAADAGLI